MIVTNEIFAQPLIVREFAASNNNGATYGTNISICINSPFTLKFKPRVNLKYYIYKSTDGGNTWTSTTVDPSITYADVTVLSYPAFSTDTKLRIFYTTDYQTVGVPLSSYIFSDEIITLTVNPLPNVNNVSLGQSTICQNSTTLASNTTLNGVWSSDDITVATINASTGVITGTGSGLAYIYYTVTDINNCVSSKNAVITVNPTPSIANISDAVCSGSSYTKNPNNINGNFVPVGTTYDWGLPSVGVLTGAASGTVQNNFNALLTNPTNASITATYTLTATKGSCTSAPFNVNLAVTPTPVIANRNVSSCSGLGFSDNPRLTPNPGDIVPTGIQYSWVAPSSVTGITNQAASGTPSPTSFTGLLNNTTTGALSMTYTINTYNAGCQGTTFTETVTVNPTPSIAAKSATICSNNTFNINLPGVGDLLPAGTTYSWNAPTMSGINGLQAGANTSTITGTLSNTTSATISNINYSVTPFSANGCQGPSFSVLITVKPVPVMTDGGPTQIGSGSAFNFAFSGTIIPIGTTYSWPVPTVPNGISGEAASGTPSATSLTGTLLNPTAAYLDVPYIVSPIYSGCVGANFTYTVRVYPKPIIGLKQFPICSGGSVSFIPQDGNPAGEVVPSGTTYSWAAPTVAGITGTISGTTQSAFNSGILYNSTNFPIAVDFSVTPLAAPQAGDPFTVRITVNPLPTTSIVVTDNSGLNVNDRIICSDALASFTASPTVGALTDYNYSWTVPVGLTAPGNASNFNSVIAGNYTLSLTHKITGCSSASAIATTLTVNTIPNVGTISGTVNTVCVNSSIPLTAIGSNGGTTPYTSYWWYAGSSGGPATTGGPVVNVTGVAAGTGSITYSVLDNVACMSNRSASYNITVYDLPLIPTVAPTNLVYDGLSHALLASPATAPIGTDRVEWFANASGGSIVSPWPSITNVGTITYYAQASNTITGCTNQNRIAATATITQKRLTITANDFQKIYDRVPYAGGNGVVYSGFVNNETTSVLSGTLTYTGTAQNAVNVGTYSIIPGGYASLNYDINYVAGVLTIAKKAVSITGATVLDKVYDATDIAILNTGSLLGIVPADAANIILNRIAKFATKNVGTNILVTSYSTLTGTAAPNYNLDPSVNLTGSIFAKHIDAIGTQTTDKIYDGTISATVTGGDFRTAIAAGTGTVSDLTPYIGDAIQYHPAGSFSSKDAATNSTIISSATITGSEANNYILDQPILTSRTISPKELTMLGLTITNPKIYDATRTAIVSGTASLLSAETPGVGSVTDGKPYSVDQVSIAGNAIGTYNTKDVATANTVSFSGLSLTGANAANYYLTMQSNYASSILVKRIFMNGLSVPSTKVYDATTNAINYGTPSLLNAVSTSAGTNADGRPYIGDNVTISGTPNATYNSKDVLTATNVMYSGLYISGNDASNYNLVMQTNDPATITPKGIHVNAIAQSKIYGNLDPSFTYTNDTLYSGDQFTGALDRVTGENVGVYQINQGSLQLNPNYSIIYTNNTLTIQAAGLILQPNPIIRTYGDAPLAATMTSSNFTIAGLKNNDAMSTITIQLPTTIGMGNSMKDPVATYTGVVIASNLIAAGSTTLSNYQIQYLPGDIIVDAYPITIVADAKQKRKNQVDPPLTYTISRPLVAGDSLTGTLDRVPGEAVGFYSILRGTVTINDNYAIKYIPADLEILTIDRVIVVPNAFTPNNDGLNDVIKAIYNSTVTSFNYFKIFDRSGKQIFETKNSTEGWDGKLNGAVAESDAYFWMIEYNTWDNKVYQVKGSFILIK